MEESHKPEIELQEAQSVKLEEALKPQIEQLQQEAQSENMKEALKPQIKQLEAQSKNSDPLMALDYSSSHSRSSI